MWIEPPTRSSASTAGNGRTAGEPAARAGTRLRRSAWLTLAAPLLASLVLSGCGLSSSGRSASAHVTDDSPDNSSDGNAADPNAGLVAAVNPDSSGGPINVKFRVEARPMVGSPVKIRLAVMAAGNAQIAHLHGALLPGEGLTLQSDRSFDLSDVQSGSTLYREVTVVPTQPGVLSLSATILVDMNKGTQSRTYSIPLIAADSSS
jgi:hypothetical protein